MIFSVQSKIYLKEINTSIQDSLALDVQIGEWVPVTVSLESFYGVLDHDVRLHFFDIDSTFEIQFLEEN